VFSALFGAPYGRDGGEDGLERDLFLNNFFNRPSFSKLKGLILTTGFVNGPVMTNSDDTMPLFPPNNRPIKGHRRKKAFQK
jgi:hypothetical protein